MNAPSVAAVRDATRAPQDVADLMQDIGRRARAASRVLALAPTGQKDEALAAMAAALRRAEGEILAGNEDDLAAAREAGRAPAFIDRLTLDIARVEAMARGIEDIAALPDPVGNVIAAWERPNGLKIERVRTPLGVIGVIYESRPNVTSDAGALCLKAGNAVILRGGSESFHSTRAIHAALAAGLKQAGLPEDAVQLVPTTDRAAVGEMLAGLGGNVDVIVPRGGRSLVERVQSEARVPVFAHLEGICHVYVDKAADLAMAEEIVVNSKMRRTGICGAAETLLVDRAAAETHLGPLVRALIGAGCEVRGEEPVQAVDERVTPATSMDFGCEFLDAIIAVKLVDGVDGAMAHIAAHGSQHTEAIVTGDEAVAARFLVRGRRRDRAAQRLDAVRRRRRIRHGRRDRHRHGPHARARPGRGGAADELQLPRARHRPDASVRSGSIWPKLPPVGQGQSVGLLGGSFNPPHLGHVHISRLAMMRLGLDQVWWLVTPGNPLKDHGELGSLEARLAACRDLAALVPGIRVTSVEADIGLSRTRDTLRFLTRRCRGIRLVWLMGADNMASFHRWHAWQEIARMVPIGVIDRPGSTLKAASGAFASRFSAARLAESDARLLPAMTPPAWVVVHGPRSDLSSTEIRRAGLWPQNSSEFLNRS